MKNFIIFCVHNISYWLTSGIFFIADKLVYNMNLEKKYKIQPRKIDWKKYKMFAMGVLKNEIFMSLPLSLLFDYYNLNLHLFTVSPLKQLPVIIVLHDFLFYHAHRACHSKILFKFHKQHHKLTIPVGVGALYASPFEHIFVNILPAMLPPKIIGAEFYIEIIWILLATINVVMAHSDYKKFSENHDLHHTQKNVNFGLGFFIFDRLYGTYKPMV